jgi:hypothetical protein
MIRGINYYIEVETDLGLLSQIIYEYKGSLMESVPLVKASFANKVGKGRPKHEEANVPFLNTICKDMPWTKIKLK